MATCAVIIPCFNEGAAIGKVVSSFKEVLPDSRIYVYDNNSQDNTAEEAQKAGAIVRRELQQGKGNVVRRMFADVDADVAVRAFRGGGEIGKALAHVGGLQAVEVHGEVQELEVGEVEQAV